jgi:L-threonylcarbamoyladenylate synthase
MAGGGGTLGLMDALTSKSPKSLPPGDAAEALRCGKVVLAPTETVFGLAADGSSEQALGTVWGIGPETSRQPLAWHLARTTTLVDALDSVGHRLSPVQTRLIERLCPGPLLLAIEMESSKRERLLTDQGLAQGVVDDSEAVLVRLIDQPQTGSAIEQSQRPIVMRSIPGSRAPRTVDEAARALERAGGLGAIAGVIESAARPMGRSSTLVRFLLTGGYRVDREGAYAARYIDKQLMRTILFVCTGNTCRSPMAEALARGLIDRSPLDLPTQVKSAGAFTSGGMPATPEAVEAVESLGFSLPSHSSSVLTRELITQADEIYGLTASHIEAIRAIDPNAANKVQLLDPTGEDVPDPIGQSQSVYNQTAEHLLKLIQTRLAEHRSSAEKQDSTR